MYKAPLMKSLLTVFVLLCAFATVAQAAGVYKWTDEKGVVHFTDRPPNRDDAVEVPGVRARGTETDRILATKATPGEEVTAQMLQGLWCEFEITTTNADIEPIIKRVEWDFYEGDEVQYRDLETGRRIETTFRVEAGEIITEDAEMGTHEIRSYRPEMLELGSGSTVYRLRSGGC